LACTPQKPFAKAFAFVAAGKEHSRAHALCLWNFCRLYHNRKLFMPLTVVCKQGERPNYKLNNEQ